MRIGIFASMIAILVTGTSCSESSNPTPVPAATGATDPQPVVDIWTPAALGDVAILRSRIIQTSDVDALDPTFQTTAISFAASFGKLEAVKALLDAGADPNIRNGNRSTPAIGAALFGRPYCLKALLDAGANPQLADEAGTTAFTALLVPWEITKVIGDLLQMPLDLAVLEEGRARCNEVLQSQ